MSGEHEIHDRHAIPEGEAEFLDQGAGGKGMQQPAPGGEGGNEVVTTPVAGGWVSVIYRCSGLDRYRAHPGHKYGWDEGRWCDGYK